MRYWCDGSPVWTHYGNASSILFPAWEKAFAAVIEHYLPKVSDPSLKSRMVQFRNEELAHAKAHEAFNKRHGLEAAQEQEIRRAKIVHKKPGLQFWLGTMVSIEHLAACMSRSILNRWEGTKGRDYQVFLWHAKEELGHKSLAIDLWNYLGYSRSDLRKIAKINQVYVLKFLVQYTIKNVKIDGQLKHPSTWKDLILWGIFFASKVLIPATKIYFPRFHPDNQDDSKWVMA